MRKKKRERERKRKRGEEKVAVKSALKNRNQKSFLSFILSILSLFLIFLSFSDSQYFFSLILNTFSLFSPKKFFLMKENEIRNSLSTLFLHSLFSFFLSLSDWFVKTKEKKRGKKKRKETPSLPSDADCCYMSCLS